MKLEELERRSTFDKVCVDVKVIDIEQPVKVSGGKTKQDVTIADASSAARVSLWAGKFGCQFWQFTGQQKLPILAIICLSQLSFLAKNTQAELSTKIAKIGNNMFIKVAIFGQKYTSTVVNKTCQNWQ